MDLYISIGLMLMKNDIYLEILKNQTRYFYEIKKYRNLLKCLTLLDTYFMQNPTWYPKFFRNFAIFYRFLHLIPKSCDFSYKNFSIF